MCGIAAIIGPKPMEKQWIRRMTDIASHRGPDGVGHLDLEDGKIWLGHLRLAIIDLSDTGKQPMTYSDGRYWITYNGEVYNYIELRAELEKLGYRFISQSDTEVMLAAYDHWGKECLHHFNGMWAFVLVDLKEKKVFVARDRFGVKPLYYWRGEQGWAFASEIKQFTVLPGWNPEMNGQRVADYLGYAMMDHTNETMFKHVYQIRGGEAAEFTYSNLPATLPVFPWYTLAPKAFHGNYDQAVQTLLELFTDSIRLRLRADVSIGSCLSGGLDSSAIVCVLNDILLKKNVHELQKTFSAYAEVKRYDESQFVEEVIGTRKIEGHHVHPPQEELFDTLDELTWHQDEPFGSTSIYAQWHVFKLAHGQKIKVMLDGQGADEQLAGYYPYFGTRLSELLVRFRWIRLFRELYLTSKGRHVDRGAVFRRLVNALLPALIVRKVTANLNPSAAWFDLSRLSAESLNFRQIFGEFKSDVNAMGYAQMTRTNLPMLLHWEDRNSMAHSIEARVPFLDYRLVEFLTGLPSDYKIHDATTKRVLRDGMRGILPHKIRERQDKLGFVTPEEEWVKQNFETFRLRLNQALIGSRGLFSRTLMEDFDRLAARQSKYDAKYWRIICLESWRKSFFENRD